MSDDNDHAIEYLFDLHQKWKEEKEWNIPCSCLQIGVFIIALVILALLCKASEALTGLW